MIKNITWLLLLPVMLMAQGKKWVVAQDGSGEYTSVQAALNAAPVHSKTRIIILIRKGVYMEKLKLDSSKNFITLRGEDKFSTVLTYNDHTGKITAAGDTINTRNSASFLMKGDDFIAENITFRNDAGFTAGQAVAVEVRGDRAAFRNCRFIGNQDVLFTNNDHSREYYADCYIEGTTDFIFGSATAWFEKCHIHSKKNSHVTAASTPADHPYGYIFNECILTADTSVHNASLGRPWRPYASVTYLDCYLDRHIRTEGWSAWNNTDSYKLSRYAEYRSSGPGANPLARVSWSRQLQQDEVKNYTLKNVFGDWDPMQLFNAGGIKYEHR